MTEQTFTCPISGNSITPLEVRQISVVTWFSCDEPCHVWEGSHVQDWHASLSDANRADAKHLYTGSYTRALHATRTSDAAAIVAECMARRTEREVQS